MGFFSDLMGSSQRQDIANARGQADGYLSEGYRDATGAVRTGMTQAQGYLEPYAQSGRQANTLYGNALGVNGRDAQTEFMGSYANNDPFRAHNEEQANRSTLNAFTARGMGNSGAANLAVARGSLDRGSQDYQQYLTRLQGYGQQGQQVAGQQAQYAYQGNAQIGQYASDYGNTRAGNAINYGNALAQSRTQGVNNILNGTGTLAGAAFKAFAPGGVPGGAPGGVK